MALGILIFWLAFFAMEGIAWFSHKYVMHKLMWYFHQDHHKPYEHFFQKNDVFFLLFAIPSWLGIMLGLMYKHYLFVWAGFGIMLYGFAYFLVHDVFIHQRFKWFGNSTSPYLLAIRKAHKMHHKHAGKEDGECFGLLYPPHKYIAEARKFRKIKQ